MKRRVYTHLSILLTALLALTAYAAHAAGGDGRAAVPDPAAPEGVAVDFERVVQAPQGLQQAILRALEEAAATSPQEHLTATVLETTGEWAHVVLVPTAVLDSNWELPLDPGDIVDVVAYLNSQGAWQAVVKGEETLPWLQANVPGDFMTFGGVPPAQVEEDFLFPWTSGQFWRVSQSWHSGAIDLFPLSYSNPPIHGAVLAMGTGTLSQVCNDGAQAHLRVDHGGVTSGYLHLDASTVRGHDLNQTIPRGRYLGLLYDGEAVFDPNPYCAGGSNWQYATPCGCGTGAHLHWSSTNTGITVDGQNLYAVGASQGTYVSSNVRDEGPPPPSPAVTTVVPRAALTPGFTAACGSGWKQIGGYESHPGYVTLNTNQPAQSTNAGEWLPTLPQEGRYQVAAYIPNHSAVYWDCGSVDRSIPADTTDARYRIMHTGGATTVSGNQGPLADQWLPLGTYHLRQSVGHGVQLTDLNGEDNLSRTVSYSAMRFVLLPPDAPGGLRASDSSYVDRVQLTWNAALGAAGYDIYRAPDGGGAPVKIGSGTALSFDDTSAARGTRYTYTIRAVNPAGAGAFSLPDGGSRRGLFSTFLPVAGK